MREKSALNLLYSALAALVFTLLMLNWSYDRFRLVNAPFLDDVNWMDEGLDMLASARDGGISGFLGHIASSGTLAPYSATAAIGFAIFGVRDWAPYVMNGWLIFSLLAFVEIARRRAGLTPRTWFLAAALALAFPIAGHSVVSFLGDNASGLFIAIGAIAFIEGWPSSESALESWTGALAWIFAFYGKATLFPETMLVFLLSACIGCWIALQENPAARRYVIRRWAWRALAVLLIVLPYYIVVARPLRDYLYVTNWGWGREIWAFKGTALESLLYYVTGFSGETMLGPALYLALALILSRCALLVHARPVEKLRFASLLSILAITYALPTYMVNKTLTVGAPFQFLVVLTAVLCLYAALARLPRRPPIIEIAVAIAVLLVFRFPQPLDRHDSPAVLARNRVLSGLIDALEKQNVRAGEPVFLTSTGYVSTNTLRYEFVKQHLPMPRFYENSLSGDASQFPALIGQGAFVIATEPGNDDVFYTAPSAFIQARTLAIVQQNPAFVEAARFSTWRGKHYYLFGRSDRVRGAPAENDSSDAAPPGPAFVHGFSNAGPDKSRWCARESEVEFPAPRGLYAEFKVRFFIPQSHIAKLGPITIEADIPREGRHRETFLKEGIQELSFRYAIKQHLVSTTPVRLYVNKSLPSPDGSGEQLGVLVLSASLDPIAHL